MRILSFLVLILLYLFAGIGFAQSPHGSGLKLDCSACHNPNNWKVNPDKMEFKHSSTNFKLVGQHATVDCRSCHTNLVFDKAPEDCNSCHKDIHQETVGLDCAKCHTPKSWMVDDINGLHQQGRFPLLGKHQIADCAQCHTRYTDLYFEPLDTDCFSCHENDYNSTTSPNHISAGFSTDCELCHSLTADDFAGASIIHDFFPLVEGHAIDDCFACHTQGGDFSGLSQDCYSCHQQDYENVQDPNHIQANFSTDCTQCHTIAGWTPANFDHNQTAFPLTGKHIPLDCSTCHTTGFSGTPTDCYACHQQDYESTNDPNHVAEGFPTDCIQCHTTDGWDGAEFDHNLTNFPLTGKHITVDCADCHTNGFSGTPTDCYACHQQDYEGTNDPNHVTEGFPTDCVQCHTTEGWEGAEFDHNQTNFPLTGAHITLDCSSCHENGFSGTPTDCYACHQQDYETVTDPNHINNNYVTDCTQCHVTNDWQTVNFDHNLTNFELTGAHITVDCSNCHQNGFDGTPIECNSCHNDDYINTTDPDHQAANFPVTCEDCHTTTAWTPATFDHDGQYFPIYTGKHAGEWDVCADCHTVPSDFSVFTCIDCHEHRQSEMDPEHEGVQGYVYESNACYECHPTGEKEGAFNHGLSNFPLTGAHLSLDCQQCHENGYNNTPTDCVACHQQNFDNTTNPDHQTLNLPTDCGQCHTTNPDWQPAEFPNHEQYFPLTGGHQQVANDCAGCHNGDYNNTPEQCVACHQDEYNNAPEHTAQNYPTDCTLCHTLNAWDEVSFDHSNTNFPLTGAHQNVDCANCHENGYTGTTTVCYDCHQSNFEQTTNPDHQTLNLPTDCEQCHNTNPNWQPATFPIHDQFYELVGAHANISDDCASCHNGDYNNTPNTCFGCHSSDFNGTTDPPHQSLNFSHDCMQCHNQNAWQPANFDHNFYALSGDHISLNCNECHSQSGYQPQCISCHLEDFLDEHDQGDPTNCWDCHTTFNWDTGDSFLKMKSAH